MLSWVLRAGKLATRASRIATIVTGSAGFDGEPLGDGPPGQLVKIAFDSGNVGRSAAVAAGLGRVAAGTYDPGGADSNGERWAQ